MSAPREVADFAPVELSPETPATGRAWPEVLRLSDHVVATPQADVEPDHDA